MKIFELRPGDGKWEGEYWKLSSPQMRSSYAKVIQDPQDLLREQDIGQVFVRCFPHQLPKREERDFSFLPASSLKEDCEDVALKLVAVGEKGELHFREGISLEKDWNDGHWIKLHDYWRAIHGIREVIIPPSHFYRR